MGNSTFSGPVRSQNGFQDITTNATTGVDTTNSTYGNNAIIGGDLTVRGSILSGGAHPALNGLAVTAKATAGTVTYAAGINVNPFTGAAQQVTTLPAATVGVVVVHAQSVDTTGGTNFLSFDCAGTDAYETGSVIESRTGAAVVFDKSTAGETLLKFFFQSTKYVYINRSVA